MVVRHGKVVGEGWWSPYGPTYKHVLFSASKTFAATGIGLAVAEGRLKTTDKVVSFFPHSLPDALGPRTRELDVKDLLTMSVGQEPAAQVRGRDDWIRAFLETEPVHEPGTVFLYNNYATFMLSAIVQQVTGETLFDYLRPRIFEPLGIRGVDWDLSPQGINMGMLGLRFRTEDLAKFGQLLLQRGKWNGKQLLPESLGRRGHVPPHRHERLSTGWGAGLRLPDVEGKAQFGPTGRAGGPDRPVASRQGRARRADRQ